MAVTEGGRQYVKGRWVHNGNTVPQIPRGIKTCSNWGKSKLYEKKCSAHLDANTSWHHYATPLNSIAHPVLLLLYWWMPVFSIIMFSLVYMLGKSLGIFIFNQKNFISTVTWTKIISIRGDWPFHISVCAHTQEWYIMPETNFWSIYPSIFFFSYS